MRNRFIVYSKDKSYSQYLGKRLKNSIKIVQNVPLNNKQNLQKIDCSCLVITVKVIFLET